MIWMLAQSLRGNSIHTGYWHSGSLSEDCYMYTKCNSSNITRDDVLTSMGRASANPTQVQIEFMKVVTPRAHAQQGVKQSVPSVCLSAQKSPDLGIWATRNNNESVETFEKLTSLCFESFGRAHERHKHCVFLGHAYQLHPHVLSAHACNIM